MSKCNALHRAKKISSETLLGFESVTVTVFVFRALISPPNYVFMHSIRGPDRCYFTPSGGRSKGKPGLPIFQSINHLLIFKHVLSLNNNSLPTFYMLSSCVKKSSFASVISMLTVCFFFSLQVFRDGRRSFSYSSRQTPPNLILEGCSICKRDCSCIA